MSSLLSAELAATCNALGYYDIKSNKYYADSNTLETVKDLIRYLRRDDETHDIRRQLGETKVLQTDLLPLLKSYWEETDLFDVLLRLLVNLTTPALILWNEEPPNDKTSRNYYLQIEDHLKNYKQAFNDEAVWSVLSTRLSKILEIDYSERGDENSLIIERILILIRNILYIPPDPYSEKRPDNDASIHDQVLWALQQSGMLDIILFISSSGSEKAYYMHTLEILSFMLKEQRASELAQAALQRSEMEKITDEAELLAIRHRETNQRQQKVKMYNGARHSRFGGTYVVKSMKSISDNELIYHKPLNKLNSLNFNIDKKKPKTPKNRCPVESNTFERRSAFTIRLFLKEFCVEFLNGAYNTLMYHVKDNLVRAKAQAHDESYYLWALRFFMEFNRCYKFEVKLVSETMSLQSFYYVQQLTEKYFDQVSSDKKKCKIWALRLHLAVMAYRELLLTLLQMGYSTDSTVRESAKVIKSNIFYILEYRELVISLLMNYDELKMSKSYLKDLMETQNIFLKMLEKFCGTNGSVMVQKKSRVKRKKKTDKQQNRNGEAAEESKLDLNNLWDETSPQLSSCLNNGVELPDDIVPFDAASDVPIDEQKVEAVKNIQRKLRSGEFEMAIGLYRAAREVWPENDCFGTLNMAVEEEFLALREIFFAELGDDENGSSARITKQQPIYNDNDEVEGNYSDEDEDEDEERITYEEGDIKFQDVVKRLCNPKIVRACGLALKEFETNTPNTNHCIIKLLHRIAFDCNMYVMVFQVSIFQTFQKIYSYKALPQYKPLVKFAEFIIRKFIKVTENNEKIYIEALFWKTKNEAYDIEYGYGSFEQKSSALARAWTELQEDELRRLFMEHQENQLKDDVVDWIVNNLIDNTRSRRAVLKKLKEMCLLTDYKGRTKSGNSTKIPRQWGVEEETQLRELFQQFKDTTDPVGCIIENLIIPRSKKNCIEKLLELGVIQDKKEVYKKRTKKSNKDNNDQSDDESSNENKSQKKRKRKSKNEEQREDNFETDSDNSDSDHAVKKKKKLYERSDNESEMSEMNSVRSEDEDDNNSKIDISEDKKTQISTNDGITAPNKEKLDNESQSKIIDSARNKKRIFNKSDTSEDDANSKSSQQSKSESLVSNDKFETSTQNKSKTKESARKKKRIFNKSDSSDSENDANSKSSQQSKSESLVSNDKFETSTQNKSKTKESARKKKRVFNKSDSSDSEDDSNSLQSKVDDQNENESKSDKENQPDEKESIRQNTSKLLDSDDENEVSKPKKRNRIIESDEDE